ncbi:capsid and scaffold protein [Lactococcus phage CHPC972]|uniref:Capsid and scaffold protein n=1 Tax=Lactococcus phage CHPC972 TaxID=2675260 RepID=A0A650EU89_9CAUD|nr:virion structural protein [Lactococcus phage CHPC972]QGT53516.1 capsid and scaffold protein [Lactococcus phage CHPC972]
MFSWLNFEELLIHNPIELINPSKDTISVAMSKKQYIEFFSNKYTYNGLYYDEAMDFCLFYYADPLQSYKEGDVYAQGYIDVEMKIYRVKWLCNVSIKLPLAPETTGNLLDVKDGAGFSGTGNGQSNMGIGWFHFNEWKKISQVFKAGDKITISCEIAFFDTELYSDSEATHVRFQTKGGDWRQLFKVDVKNVNGKFYTREAFKTSEFTENPSHRVKVSQTMDIDQYFITQNGDVNHVLFVFDWIPNGANISVNDLKIELNGVEKKHTAYAYSPDGKDRFSTIYPRYNLLSGTKDFSGFVAPLGGWDNDGTYKGMAVKRRMWQWGGLFKPITMQKDGVYTFSAYIKASGENANIYRYVECWDINGKLKWVEPYNVFMGNNFDWKRDYFTLNLKKGDTLHPRYEIAGSGTLWIAGYKWEEGSFPTPYMPSESETTKSDRPSYIGQYTDYTLEDSTNPSSYTWREIQEDKWNVTKTGMLVSPQTKQITMVQAGALMRCEINNNISGWTDGTTQLNCSGQDFVIDGYGMRGLHNG